MPFCCRNRAFSSGYGSGHRYLIDHASNDAVAGQGRPELKRLARTRLRGRALSYTMERRSRESRKRKLAASGRPERKMPSSTMAKLSGGTRAKLSGGTSRQGRGSFGWLHGSMPRTPTATVWPFCSASWALLCPAGTYSFMARTERQVVAVAGCVRFGMACVDGTWRLGYLYRASRR